jgi:hypothetical protein
MLSFSFLTVPSETGATIEGDYEHHSVDLDFTCLNPLIPYHGPEIVNNDVDILGI